MNPIDKALSDLKFKIPKPILEKAFKLESMGWLGSNRRSIVSVDHMIKEQVIYPRVMEDCNLVGGQEVLIPLDDIYVEITPDNKSIWRIPLNRTENRRITRVFDIVINNFLNNGLGNYQGHDGNALMATVRGISNSHSPIRQVAYHDIRLIGENTILGEFAYTQRQRVSLRCMLENEATFNNLPGTAFSAFSRLVEYAVKAYIYNTLIIELDEAALSGGQQLGSFLNQVENYADANELYAEHLKEVWTKVAFMSDRNSFRRHVKQVVGGLH